MLTTWKKELPVADKVKHEAIKHTVKIPMGSEIGDAIAQDGNIVVYFDCDTDAQMIDHTFYVSGTGYDNEVMRDEVVRRIGTVNTGDGWIWHVYDKPFGK